MNSRKSGGHPRVEALALFARGDLAWFERRPIMYHVRHCAECEHEVEQFRASLEELRRGASAGLPPALEPAGDWSRIEREMTGNINVGVAASRCIEKVGSRRLRGWRGPAVIAGLAIVFVAGWFLNMPHSDTARILSALHSAWGGIQPRNGTVVQATSKGVAVRAQGAMLTLLHPGATDVTVSVNGAGSVGARYVDDETGQVTIASVYGQ
jgi:hypothetical protein